MPHITPTTQRPRSPQPLDRALLAFVLLAPAIAGCGRERRQITPTTTGTDLVNIPRGKMTPLPFPGSSLARSGAPRPTADPATTPASAADPR